MTDEPQLLRAVRCPSCGTLPIRIISRTQAVCGSPESVCGALLWNPLRTPADQLADSRSVDLSPLEGAAEGIRLPEPPAPLPVGDPAEIAAEAEIRESYHRLGYRCAEVDRCAVCE